MTSRFSIVPAVYAILECNDEVLLSQRSNTSYMDGYYGLVSGHIEENESATAACVREIEEEVGLILKNEKLKICRIFYRKAETRTSLDIFFSIQLESKIGVSNKEPEKCSDLRWFPKNDLPEKVIPYVYDAVTNSEIFVELGFSKGLGVSE